MRLRFLALLVLGGCVSTNTFPRPRRSDPAPLAVGHGSARAEADPQWRQARESLERLSASCETRRLALERRAEEARVASGVATGAAAAAVIVGEVATSGRGPVRGVSLGDARCPAPAGPTTTLSPEEQETAIPCGGMAAAGGGGPIAQRNISLQLTAADQAEAMREAIAAAEAWLDARRTWPTWSEEDVAEWDVHHATLRSLCVE